VSVVDGAAHTHKDDAESNGLATSRNSHIFFFGVCAVHVVLCSLYSRRLNHRECGRLSSCYLSAV